MGYNFKDKKSLENYRNSIDHVIKNGGSERNGSFEHASIVLERMLANAIKSIHVLSRTLNPKLYGADELVNAADEFTSNPGTTLKILVEEPPVAPFLSHPLLIRMLGRKNVEMRAIPKYLHDPIDINFAVMDSKCLRFEEDKYHPLAVIESGDLEWSTKLEGVFDVVWKESSPITPPQSLLINC